MKITFESLMGSGFACAGCNSDGCTIWNISLSNIRLHLNHTKPNNPENSYIIKNDTTIFQNGYVESIDDLFKIVEGFKKSTKIYVGRINLPFFGDCEVRLTKTGLKKSSKFK